MRRIITILIIVLLSFGLGWWINDTRQISSVVIADVQRLNSLKNSDTLSFEGSKVVVPKSLKRKTIRDYVSDDQFIRWAPSHPDTTSYRCEIIFHKITAVYWYHGQCGYAYFTHLTSDTTIEVLWSYRADCILDMNFLEKSNGIIKHPKHGDTFATFTLVNDTILQVKYDFPEWIKKVNEIAKDSLFPKYYYLRHGD